MNQPLPSISCVLFLLDPSLRPSPSTRIHFKNIIATVMKDGCTIKCQPVLRHGLLSVLQSSFRPALAASPSNVNSGGSLFPLSNLIDISSPCSDEGAQQPVQSLKAVLTGPFNLLPLLLPLPPSLPWQMILVVSELCSIAGIFSSQLLPVMTRYPSPIHMFSPFTALVQRFATFLYQ